MRAATVEGKPNTPLPMIEFTTSATRLQRPMARSSSRRGGFAEGDSIRVFVSQMEDPWMAMRIGRRASPIGSLRSLRAGSGFDRFGFAQGKQLRRLSLDGPFGAEVRLPSNSKVTS